MKAVRNIFTITAVASLLAPRPASTPATSVLPGQASTASTDRRTVLDTQLLMDNSADVNYLQVLTARQSLLSARLTAVQDQYDAAQGVIQLYHALGGGTD